MNSKSKMRGEIEVRLEDKRGNVKERQVVQNTITDPYLKLVLMNAMVMGSSNLNNITKGGSGNFVSGTNIATYGIYAMSDLVTINRDTYLPPYVDKTQTGLHPSVVFYNVNGNTTESIKEMTPELSHCYYDTIKNECTMEYVKKTYAGTIRSIAIGRVHNTIDSFIFICKHFGVPAEMYHTTASPVLVDYALEHTSNGTILYKVVGTGTEYFSCNLKTGQYNRVLHASAASRISGHIGGLIVNGNLFRVARKGNPGAASTIATLSWIKGVFNDSATSGSIDISFTPKDASYGSTVTELNPVLVARPDLGKLEIFVTVQLNTNSLAGTELVCIRKASIDISEFDTGSLTSSNITMESTIDFKYAISSHGTTVGSYQTGLYHDGKYYLPIFASFTGSSANYSPSNVYQQGVIVSSDFSTIHNLMAVRNAANQFNAPVIVQEDKVAQMKVNTTEPTMIQSGQIISGANLPYPITKTENDILRLIYRYRFN
jgi:hypothetical protein